MPKVKHLNASNEELGTASLDDDFLFPAAREEDIKKIIAHENIRQATKPEDRTLQKYSLRYIRPLSDKRNRKLDQLEHLAETPLPMYR